MPPAPWIAGSRDVMAANEEGTDWRFHCSHLLLEGLKVRAYLHLLSPAEHSMTLQRGGKIIESAHRRE
jgi:hypothetical protein